MVCIKMLSDPTFNSDQLFQQESFGSTYNLMETTKLSQPRPLTLPSYIIIMRTKIDIITSWLKIARGKITLRTVTSHPKIQALLIILAGKVCTPYGQTCL